MDPYAILICRSHEQKSSVASGPFSRFHDRIRMINAALSLNYNGRLISNISHTICKLIHQHFVQQWNETFVFTIAETAPSLSIKIMDKDAFTADDFVGEANIPLDGVFAGGGVPPTSYSIVKDGEFKGEIRVGLTFTLRKEVDFPPRRKVTVDGKSRGRIDD